jgi:arsenite methyltransferase
MTDESTMSYCCKPVEKNNEEISCCGDDYEVTDDSKIENPKNPKTEIDLETLNKIEDMGKSLDMEIIGFGKIPKEILKENQRLQYSNAIVFTMQIGEKIINEPPSKFAQELNNLLYDKFGKSIYILSDYLRGNGFATQVAHPHQNLLDLPQLVERSGIGTVGRSHLLITPELGPCQKIGAILTSIENLKFSKENTHKWINDYCKRCGKCIKACPEDALQKDYMDENKANFIESQCLGCNQGCTYCIEECPFYKDGYSYVKKKHDKLEAKLKEKGKL